MLSQEQITVSVVFFLFFRTIILSLLPLLSSRYTVFTLVIHALFLTKILYLNLGYVIYARK